MKLSTRSRYGTRMLLDIILHGDDGPVRIGEISKRQGVSVKYLEKLIRPLKRANYIKSRRGPKGGHMLSRAPGDITVGEIVRLLEGEPALADCVKNIKTCRGANDCLMRGVWVEATKGMYSVLDNITFEQLARDVKRCTMEEASVVEH